MSNLPRRETAKIYRFPDRPRTASVEARHFDRDAPSRLAATGIHAGAWYHEAAIQEERGRKP